MIFGASAIGLTMPTKSTLDIPPGVPVYEMNDQGIMEKSATLKQSFEFQAVINKPNYTIPLGFNMFLSLAGLIFIRGKNGK